MLNKLFKSSITPYVDDLEIPLTYETLYDEKLQKAFEDKEATETDISFLISMHRENLICDSKDLETDKGAIALLNDLIQFNYLVNLHSFGVIREPSDKKKSSIFFRA